MQKIYDHAASSLRAAHEGLAAVALHCVLKNGTLFLLTITKLVVDRF